MAGGGLLRNGLLAFSWALYGSYMVSLVVWLLVTAALLRRQQRRAVHEWEYVSVRLFVLYAAADVVRTLDLCFATDAMLTDGACRSAWGVVPLWLRVLAWWVRDMTMLAGLAYFLDFAFGWTHAVIGQPPPWSMRAIIRGGIPGICVGLSSGAAAIVGTNRVGWIFYCVIWVLVLNTSTSAVSWQLLTRTLPEVRRRLPSELGLEARTLLRQVEVVAYAMLLLAAAIVVGFLPTLALRLGEGALGWALVPWCDLGESAADVRFRTLSALPVEVTPNPIPEAVEFLVGWALLAGLALPELGRAPLAGAHSLHGCRYVGRKELGEALLGGSAMKTE